MTYETWVKENKSLDYGTLAWWQHWWLNPLHPEPGPVQHTVPATRFRGNHADTYQPQERFTGEFVESRFQYEWRER